MAIGNCPFWSHFPRKRVYQSFFKIRCSFVSRNLKLIRSANSTFSSSASRVPIPMSEAKSRAGPFNFFYFLLLNPPRICWIAIWWLASVIRSNKIATASALNFKSHFSFKEGTQCKFACCAIATILQGTIEFLLLNIGEPWQDNFQNTFFTCVTN